MQDAKTFDTHFRADEITIGTQLAEHDGFLWDVSEILDETDETLTVRLNSDWSTFRCHWHNDRGPIVTLRKTWIVTGISRRDD